jgi:hypothetical protein
LWAGLKHSINSNLNDDEAYMLKKESLKLLPFYLFFIIITIAVSKNSFFWDTIQLASKHAHWYFENNFRNFLLPNSIDSGHIPAFGMLLAFAWKIFQKSLNQPHFYASISARYSIPVIQINNTFY